MREIKFITEAASSIVPALPNADYPIDVTTSGHAQMENDLFEEKADPGGSGTFVYLAAVLDRDGAAEPVASVLLGDRIVVKSLVVEDDEITVAMLTRQEDEPMSAEPTVAVTQVFRLQDSILNSDLTGLRSKIWRIMGK